MARNKNQQQHEVKQSLSGASEAEAITEPILEGNLAEETSEQTDNETSVQESPTDDDN